MGRIAEVLIGLITVIGWVVAVGFWQTLLAVLVWPYSWYLAVEYFMRMLGWVA
jgi:hypothetical protein